MYFHFTAFSERPTRQLTTQTNQIDQIKQIDNQIEAIPYTLGGRIESISESEALRNRSLIVRFSFLRSAPDNRC